MAQTQSISSVFRDLFRSPLQAVIQAERDYLKIWADWIDVQVKLLDDKELSEEQIQALMTKAPSVQLDGFIDVGISMRIATVKQTDIGISAGISGAAMGVAPVHASGSFGFSKSSSQESMFQASARFNVSNNNTDLGQFLAERGMSPVNVEQLKGVSDLLKKEGEA